MKAPDARVFRAIAAALVGSSLDSRDLMSFADRLRNQPMLADRLARLITDVARAIDRDPPSLAWNHKNDDASIDRIAADVVEVFSRRRLPKSQALNILRAFAGPSWKPDTHATLRQNVFDLFHFLPSDGRREIAARIANAAGYSEDPFLRELSS